MGRFLGVNAGTIISSTPSECASAQTRPVHLINVHGGDWYDSIAFDSGLARRMRKTGSDGIEANGAW